MRVIHPHDAGGVLLARTRSLWHLPDVRVLLQVRGRAASQKERESECESEGIWSGKNRRWGMKWMATCRGMHQYRKDRAPHAFQVLQCCIQPFSPGQAGRHRPRVRWPWYRPRRAHPRCSCCTALRGGAASRCGLAGCCAEQCAACRQPTAPQGCGRAGGDKGFDESLGGSHQGLNQWANSKHTCVSWTLLVGAYVYCLTCALMRGPRKPR